MKLSSSRIAIGIFGIALAVSACGGGSSSLPTTTGAAPTPTASPTGTGPTPTASPTGTATYPATVTGSGSIASGSALIAGPIGTGFQAELDFVTATPASGTTAAYTFSTNAPAAVPSPAASCSPAGLGTPLAYLSFTLNQAVAVNPGPIQKFTLPASFVIGGHTFYQTFEDVTSPSNQCSKTASSISGTTVTFNSGSGGTTLVPGHTYVLVYSYTTP